MMSLKIILELTPAKLPTSLVVPGDISLSAEVWTTEVTLGTPVLKQCHNTTTSVCNLSFLLKQYGFSVNCLCSDIAMFAVH